MKKLEEIVGNQIKLLMKQTYHFEMTDERARGMARSMINTYKQNTEISRSSTIHEVLKRYYSTTKIPPGEQHNHSAHHFALFVENSFHYLILPKTRLNKLIYDVGQFFGKLRK